ncbi:capsular biosynthesis protein [Halobacillus mangrovi]|uniref:capsular biosynthesis protein n=1 Tax=Halobacillus mangrovi TaxID=402384 RepID=UPI003D99D50E
MTMLSVYTDFLDKNNIEYDVIHIDKYGENESNNATNVYSYPIKVNRNWSKARKVKEYYGFKKFAKKIINKKQYDFIIVWNSFTAFMFADYLSLKFKGKYSINIRDYNKENLLPIYLIMKAVIKFSAFTTISSEGFKNFLPPYKYVNVYSYNQSMLEQTNPRTQLRKVNQPLRISFIGYVRFFDNDKKVIDELGNDNRFIVQYFGEGAERLKEYAQDKGYSNVICKGRFDTKETSKLLEKTDIINNLYGTGTPGLRTALSIKLYYAIYLRIPILVYKGTYMDEISKNYNINITIEDQYFQSMGDEIYNTYHNIQFNKLDQGCKDYIEVIKENQSHFRRIMKSYLI